MEFLHSFLRYHFAWNQWQRREMSAGFTGWSKVFLKMLCSMEENATMNWRSINRRSMPQNAVHWLKTSLSTLVAFYNESVYIATWIFRCRSGTEINIRVIEMKKSFSKRFDLPAVRSGLLVSILSYKFKTSFRSEHEPITLPLVRFKKSYFRYSDWLWTRPLFDQRFNTSNLRVVSQRAQTHNCQPEAKL